MPYSPHIHIIWSNLCTFIRYVYIISYFFLRFQVMGVDFYMNSPSSRPPYIYLSIIFHFFSFSLHPSVCHRYTLLYIHMTSMMIFAMWNVVTNSSSVFSKYCCMHRGVVFSGFRPTLALCCTHPLTSLYINTITISATTSTPRHRSHYYVYILEKTLLSRRKNIKIVKYLAKFRLAEILTVVKM